MVIFVLRFYVNFLNMRMWYHSGLIRTFRFIRNEPHELPYYLSIAFYTPCSVCNNMKEATLQRKIYVANPAVPLSMTPGWLQWCVYLYRGEWPKNVTSLKATANLAKHNVIMFDHATYVCIWNQAVKNRLTKLFYSFDVSWQLMYVVFIAMNISI